MKRFATIWILTAVLLMAVLPAMAVELRKESFETTIGWSTVPAFATTITTNGDYMDRYTVLTKPVGLAVLLGSLDGDYFIAGEDCNGTAPLPADGIYTVSIDAVAVAGYNNLTVSISLNAKNMSVYDTGSLANGDYLKVVYSMDGGANTQVGYFTKVGASGTNGKFGLDNNGDGLGEVEIPDYNNFNNYTFTIPVTGNSLVIRVITRFESGDEEIVYDNIRVNGDVAAATEYDARLSTTGAGASPTISSLLIAAPGQTALTFGVQDDGSGSLGLPTIINSVTIVPGTGNIPTNWTQYIGGATLDDGLGNTWTGVVNATSIVFTGTPLTTLADGGAVQNWSLKIWLKQGLPYNGDNKVLAFRVQPASFIVASAGSSSFASDPAVESGLTNNTTSVTATQLSITTQPAASVYKDSSFTVRAGFTDVYGGVDADFNENITLSVKTGTGVLSAVSGLTKLSAVGQSAWTDAKYNKPEVGVVLKAVSPTYPSEVLTNAFNVVQAPTIVVDALPTCWDKDSTNAAVPFAIHISIRDWVVMANTDAIVKVYDGLANPWHFTPDSGWSKSTYNLGYKPVIRIDANGNWSGWLALKSKNMGTFRPRAANLANSVTITGSYVVGTLLDLSASGNGAILEDRDASSHATPGNIILARNAGNAIIGSWIAETNIYPLDDGGTPILSGGWRLAVCTFCDEPVSFESWNPANWPGSGYAEWADGLDNFCADPGTINEVFDIQLPVQLASFTAVSDNGKITLNWETASESNNDKFDVVRDGASVATVRGAGSSASSLRYSWTDENVVNGTTYSYTLVSVDPNNVRSELRTIEATPNDAAAMVTEYALRQNYPNPFNPTTTIAYDVVETGFVSLKIFNLMGQAVATLVNGQINAGHHFVTFDATSLPSGLYICKMEAGDFRAQSKMMLMK